jgi:hypothetical protein
MGIIRVFGCHYHNLRRVPTSALVREGVKMGFYLNGCACGEHTEHRINYEGDVNLTFDLGFVRPMHHRWCWPGRPVFAVNARARTCCTLPPHWPQDGVKIDSCGAQKNMTLYAELFNATGRPIIIENCHQVQARTGHVVLL